MAKQKRIKHTSCKGCRLRHLNTPAVKPAECATCFNYNNYRAETDWKCACATNNYHSANKRKCFICGITRSVANRTPDERIIL